MKLKYINKEGLEYTINKIKQYIYSNYATKDDAKTPTGDTLPIGAVLEWHSDVVPENWLECNGQAVSRTDYAELFDALATKHGTGDGSTTFNLPDMRGKGPIGQDENDTDFDEVGKTGGEKEHTLTIAEMPSHTHTSKAASPGTVSSFADGFIALSNSYTQDPNFSTAANGGGQPHNNMQPHMVCKFIIKAKQSSGLVATVVDNLESASETDALSARQGKILNDNIGDISTILDNISGEVV